jgi:hypothetical protein
MEGSALKKLAFKHESNALNKDNSGSCTNIGNQCTGLPEWEIQYQTSIHIP